MRLPWRAAGLVFLICAALAPLGDHGHVVTGTTAYAPGLPLRVWGVPAWFPVLVGLAGVGLAELRLWLPAPIRRTVSVREAASGAAAVLGVYAATALVAALAVLVWRAFGDTASLTCAAAIAVVGPAVEIALARAGVFHYADGALFGVAPWLPALYAAFGVVMALFGELVANAKRL